MKTELSNFLKFLGTCLIIGLVLQNTLCYAAPLPQRIISPYLQRDDCVVREEALEEAFVPYIQEFLLTDEEQNISFYSCINWWHGFLKSEGSGKERSRFAAELVAKSNALKTLLVANLNAQSTLQQYFERRDEVMLKIRNVLIRDAQVQELPADPEKPDEARVIVTISFYGISGLTSFFVDDEEIFPKPPGGTTEEIEALNRSLQTEEYTGILIDAREITTLEPAFFPQLVSEEGEVLYSASQVERDVLVNQGMVKYVSEKEQQTSELVGERPFIVKPILLASNALYKRKSPGAFSNSGRLLLTEAKSRKGQGKGHNLIIKSTKSTGQQPVNIVLSLEDVKKLKQLNKQFKFDKQGKYIILIGREIAGGKGQYPDSIVVMRNE